MKAEFVYYEKRYLTNSSFQEIKIWKIPESKDKPHGFKYSFVYIINGKRVVGYDNAESKGDHKHYKGIEYPYKFQGLDKLWKDFMHDIEQLTEEDYEG